MWHEFFELGIFSVKALWIIILILILVAGILSLFGRGKEKTKGKILVKNLNKQFTDIQKELMTEVLAKKKLKQFLKSQKKSDKKHSSESRPNIYILNFNGDIKASAVAALREEVTAILGIIQPKDSVIVRLESPGGMVHTYGLAAAQLERFKQRKIPLTVCVDKVAASGGYMMASIADKIIAAPFAIIGSIGVIVQLPNFHRLLQEKNIDFEQITAGNYKRTLTLFGQNTKEGREKLREEIEEIHELFKQLIQEHRPQLDIEKVATGEHWLAKQAITLQLVDEIKTSDDYLLEKIKNANLFEITFRMRKTLSEKLFTSAYLYISSLLPQLGRPDNSHFHP